MTIAIITGGSRGLGRNAALHLARAGTDIIFTYRSQRAAAETVVAEIEAIGRRATALPLDAGNAATFSAFAEAVGAQIKAWGVERFDWLVNNAGEGVYTPFTETTAAQLDELYAVHVKGPYLLTQALLPLMTDGGRILNVSSGLARFAVPGYSAYAAMKGAVEVMTRYQAKELGARGISANTLAPGPIETDFGGGAVRDNAELNAMMAGQTALGRVGKPDDIGAAVAALLSGQLAWMNAQRIEVSGGMNL